MCKTCEFVVYGGVDNDSEGELSTKMRHFLSSFITQTENLNLRGLVNTGCEQ